MSNESRPTPSAPQAEQYYCRDHGCSCNIGDPIPEHEPCIGNDPACPCQDGDACHYRDAADGTKAWKLPMTLRECMEAEEQTEPKREALHGLAPTHRCPACGAFWRQCDDASWNLRSASCCGLCDAGRVELVCWLDEPKREPLSDEQIEAQIEARDALLDFISENGTASEGVQHYLDRYVRAALAAKETK